MAENFSKTYRKNKYWISYPGQFGLLLALFGAGVVLLSLAMVGFLLLQSNGNLSGGFNMEDLNAKTLRMVQVIGSVFQFGLPAILLALILKQKPADFFKLNNRVSISLIILTCVLAISGTAFSDLLARINEAIPIPLEMKNSFLSIEEKYYSQIFKIADFSGVGSFLLTLIIIAVLPAFFEELLFRGALQPVLIGWTKNAFWGILLTSIFFSLLHLSFFGFLPRMFLGLALGYVFYYSKNLWMSILFHFLNNAFAVTSFYLSSFKGKLDFSKATEHVPLVFSIGGSVLFLIIFYFFYKQCVKEQNKTAQ